MAKVLTLPERQDAQGGYLSAEDDHDLVWEPGREVQSGCTDELCECHAAPLIGERRD